jgi:RNA polymerase sporulation-specific sigma factor
MSKTHGEISLDEPLNVDGEGNELLLSDILGTEASIVFDPIEVKGETDILKMALSKLSERESTIMSLRFGLGGRDEMTQKEVADYLGISQSYISRLEKKIVRKLKKEMVKYS